MKSQAHVLAGLVLVNRDEAPARCFEAHCEGAALVASSWTEGKKPRSSRKDFASEDAALKELAKTVIKKYREGFAYAAGAVASEAGALMYAGSAADFATGTTGARLALMSRVDEGLRATVVQPETGAILHQQMIAATERDDAFIDGVLLPWDEKRMFVAWSLAPERKNRRHRVQECGVPGGEVRDVSSYREFVESNFGPVRPQLDAAGRRMLLAKPGNALEVIEVESGASIRSVVSCPPGSTCYQAALSPSGQRIASLIIQSRTPEKVTGEIAVWDVASGEQLARIPVADNCYMPRLGFTPDDRAVMITVGRPCDAKNLLCAHGQGPVGYAIADGKPAFDLSRRMNARVWHRRLSWAFSPDGTLLAVGNSRDADEIEIYDSKSLALRTTLPAVQPRDVERLAFSADGRILLLRAGPGFLEGRLLPA